MFINSYPKSVLATNVNPKSDLRNSNGFEIVILRGVILAFYRSTSVDRKNN